MSKIEIGRYSERLRRALGMKGQEVVSGELSPEVSPVIVLEDNAAEWQFLQKVRMCSSVMIQGAVVGQNTLFRLRNPAASGVVAVVKTLGASSDVVGWRVQMGYSPLPTSDLGTAGVTAVRDSRWGNPPNPTTLIASRANNVALNFSSSLWAGKGVANEIVTYLHGPFLLLPGEAVEWGTISNNINIESTMTWTEREFPALER